MGQDCVISFDCIWSSSFEKCGTKWLLRSSTVSLHVKRPLASFPSSRGSDCGHSSRPVGRRLGAPTKEEVHCSPATCNPPSKWGEASPLVHLWGYLCDVIGQPLSRSCCLSLVGSPVLLTAVQAAGTQCILASEKCRKTGKNHPLQIPYV